MKRSAAALLLAACLTSCGGGGGDPGTSPFGTYRSASRPPLSPPSPSSGSAEGFWVGRTSTGLAFNVLIKANGETWGIYGQGGQGWGAIKGSAGSGGSVLNGSGTDYYIRGGSLYTVTMEGTVTPKSVLSGSYSGGNPGNFTATYDAAYDNAALQADVAGQWRFVGVTSLGAVTTTVQVAADGSFTGSNSQCTITAGQIKPAQDGKGYYDAQATFSGPACQFNGRTVSGVGVLFSDGGRRTLGVAGLLPDGSDGFIGFGTR